jgi:hypothetical protein
VYERQVPDLFTRLPPTLFSVFTGPGASLSFSVLSRFYRHEFEREPFHLVKPVALELVEEALVASPLWTERRAELLAPAEHDRADEDARAPDTSDEAALLRVLARRVLGRLERAGWFHFEYRSTLGMVLNLYPYAARLLETLMRVARDEQPVFQGYAHSIASLLKPESFAAKPGVALLEAKRHTLEMVRELKILNRNIYAFTQRLLDEVRSAAAVLEESLDRYRQAVQANYHRLKTIDNLFRWRGDILQRLDAIDQEDESLRAAARWYGEHFSIDAAEAERVVAADLRLLRLQFETMPEITNDIDDRNARFSGVALRKIAYLLSQDKRIEGQLQLLIDALARDTAPEIDLDVYRCELLADDFLYTPPRRRAPVTRQPLASAAPIDRERVRREVAAALHRPFGRESIQELVEKHLLARRRASIAELPAGDDEQYVQLIYVVAFGLDGRSRYAFEPAPKGSGHPPSERRGDYGFPAGHLEKRGKKSR